MEFGLTLHPYDAFAGPAEIVHFTQVAEQLGYGYVLIPDHALVGLDEVTSTGGTWWDPIVLATQLALTTSRIRIAFGVLALPHYHPIHLARALATLDHVSGGRIDVGIGVGWLESEFVAMGVPFRQRGRRADEYLDVMRALWGDGPVDHRGRFFSLQNADPQPKPLQRPHPPIWIGGTIGASMSRAVTRGDAWQPMTTTLDELATGIEQLRRELAAAGRAMIPVQGKLPLWEASRRTTEHAIEAGAAPRDAFAGDLGAAREEIERAAAIGVTRMWVETPLERGARDREIARFAAAMIDA